MINSNVFRSGRRRVLLLEYFKPYVAECIRLIGTIGVRLFCWVALVRRSDPEVVTDILSFFANGLLKSEGPTPDYRTQVGVQKSAVTTYVCTYVNICNNFVDRETYAKRRKLHAPTASISPSWPFVAATTYRLDESASACICHVFLLINENKRHDGKQRE
jgi:hypothetical protein